MEAASIMIIAIRSYICRPETEARTTVIIHIESIVSLIFQYQNFLYVAHTEVLAMRNVRDLFDRINYTSPQTFRHQSY